MGCLDDSHVLSFLALATRRDVKLDCLAFAERSVALTGDVRKVDENVVAAFSRDEAVSLVIVEKFDSSLHVPLLSFELIS